MAGTCHFPRDRSTFRLWADKKANEQQKKPTLAKFDCLSSWHQSPFCGKTRGSRCSPDQLWGSVPTFSSGRAQGHFLAMLRAFSVWIWPAPGQHSGHFSPAEHQGPCKECCVMQIHTPWPDASVQHSQPRCLGATGQVGFYKQCNLQLFSGPKHLQQLMHPRHIQAEHQGKK